MSRHHFTDQAADSVLRRVCFDNSGNQRWEPIEDRTPLDDLMDEEPPVDLDNAELNVDLISWPNDNEPAPLELQVLKAEEAAAVAAWARLRMMQWLFGSGPKPREVAMRVFAMAWARYGELTGPMTGNDVAKMFGEGRAAFSARMGRLFGQPVIDRMGTEMQIPGQKNPEASAAYAENARKNTPRAHTAHRDEEEEEREEEFKMMSAEEREAKLAAAKEIHRQREAESDAAFFKKLRADALIKTA